MDENFVMDPARLELFCAGLLPDDELTLDEIEWLEEAVREAVMRRVSATVH